MDKLFKLTRKLKNGFPVSKFANFGFAPQTQILVFIFPNVAQCDCNHKPKFFLRLFFSFRDDLTSLLKNVFPGSNMANFIFAPQT